MRGAASARAIPQAANPSSTAFAFSRSFRAMSSLTGTRYHDGREK
ncbi:hypothetical protein MGWOODY_Smn582 [hydrothermal vent metagenome]|uniref:Uncharacterized protein n=1 Tax=hydrothermal vent metagenome TaxID=652676 RepID=A0A160TL78_9ZZZZ